MANTASNLLATVPASQLSGTIANGQLPASIARLDGDATFTGVQRFTNAGNTFVGSFSGNGSGLAVLDASALNSSTPADERLSATVNADDVALAAIQGLNEVVQEQRIQPKQKEAEIQSLQQTSCSLGARRSWRPSCKDWRWAMKAQRRMEMGHRGWLVRQLMENCDKRRPTPPSLYGLFRPKRHRRSAVLPDSKTWRILRMLSVLTFAVYTTACSSTFEINWSTIDDGGGSTSTGGVYSVSGTIGRPDAAAASMTGGQYSLTGGFWAIQAVQISGAPLLSIFRTSTNTVAVTWPFTSTGWTLQQNTNSVSSVNWSNVTSAIQDSDTAKTFIVNPPSGNRFYRLWKP